MAALRGALVTGASSGIGRAVALRLAEAGFVVAACGRSSSALESAFASAAPAVRARVLLCGSAAYDLAAESGCAAVVAAALDALRGAGASLALLVNNAGGGTLGSTLGDTRAAAVFDATLALDLRAPFVLTSVCAPLIASAWPDGSGAIINVSSVCGQRPMVGLGAYCIAKAGVEMLTKQTALEFAGKLRCTCVAPATVVTDFHARAGMTKKFLHDRQRNQLRRRPPAARAGVGAARRQQVITKWRGRACAAAKRGAEGGALMSAGTEWCAIEMRAGPPVRRASSTLTSPSGARACTPAP